MKNSTATIIKIAIGFIAGVLFFYSCNKTAQIEIPVTKNEVTENVAKVVQAEQTINPKIDSLKTIEKKLNEHIAWLNLNLDVGNNTIAELRKRQEKAAVNLPLDSATKQDFLVEMETLENEHDTRDAICDSINFDLKKIVNLKDQVIYNKDSLYAILRSSFNKSIEDNYKMIDFSNKQRKQIRNKKIKNYLLKAAIIAGGVLYFKK
jgi:hypothetical protein